MNANLLAKICANMNKRDMFWSLLLCNVLLSLLATGQSGKLLTGAVLTDKGEPIPYAYLQFRRTFEGTSCNEQGLFRLMVSDNVSNDSLLISCVGFKSKLIPLQNSIGELKIYLNPQPVLLQEVNVYSDEFAEKVVRDASAQLIHTLQAMPYEQEASFKYYLKKDNVYSGISESIFDRLCLGYNLDFLDKRYKYLPTNMLRFTQSRTSLFEHKIDKRGLALQGWDANRIFRIEKDIFFDGVLTPGNIRNWTFHIVGETKINEAEVYKIEFELKPHFVKAVNKPFQNCKPMQESFYDGYLFVNKANFSVLRIEAFTSRFSLMYTKYKDKLTGHLFKPLQSYLTLDYQSIDKKSYLAHLLYKDEYLDYGWDDKEHHITEYSEVIVNNLLANPQPSWSYIAKKFGPLDKEGNLSFQTTPYLNPQYNNKFWSQRASTFTEWEQIERDLTSKYTLEKQFMLTSGTRILTEDDYLQIAKMQKRDR